jgi:hypothetical protein
LDRLPAFHPSSPRSDGPESSQARASDEKRAPPESSERETDHRQPGHAEMSGREADAVKRNYWSEVPRFLRAWAEHLRRWPAERMAKVVDRTRDPAGSWRGDGNQYLDPEQHAQSKEVIAGVGRSERRLTEHMEEAQRDNAHGGRLEGIEFRRKGDERLKEKIAESLRIAPAKTPEAVIREIPDAIRYTFCFEPGSYTEGYRSITERMQSNGYRMIYSKNHWRHDPEYKGTNTRWITPEGQLFEVQFHTPESYHAKQEITHKSYERIRSRLTDRSERRELEAFQRDVCSWITAPADVASIEDYDERD